MTKNSKAPEKKETGKKMASTQKSNTHKNPGKAPEIVDTDKNDAEIDKDKIITTAVTNPDSLIHRKRSGLSPDGTIRALDLVRRTFVEEKDPDLQFPKETAIKMNKIVAVGLLCTLAEHSVSGDDTFAIVLKTQGYPTLVAAAKELGFSIPDIKSLPVNTIENTIEVKSAGVTVPDDVKEKLKEEKKIREGTKPELDPNKITSEEDVKKALEYIFVSPSRGPLTKVINTAVTFMRDFRKHQAESAENKEIALKKYESYNYGNWLDDIFGYFKPSVLFSGIGKGMATVIGTEKNPIHAFAIFKEAMKGKGENALTMSDEELVYSIKSIVRWVCNTNIQSNEKAIAALDAEKNTNEIDLCKKQIKYYNDVLSYMTTFDYGIVDTMIENMGAKFDDNGFMLDECAKANKLYNHVCKALYGAEYSTATYENVAQNVQQYAGHILNLFGDPAAKNLNYSSSNITELVERTEEEKERITKEINAAWQKGVIRTKNSAEKNA